jgi:THO complex subunit 4
MLYDRAGRSEGRAFVTYKSVHDANEAIRQFNGANANGQPIRLTMVTTAPRGSRARNPFDNITRGGGRSLADRITFPSRRRDTSSSRSASPRRTRPSDVSKPPPEGIDRYIPGQRTRSPRAGRQDSGRRPGTRGDRGDRNSRRGQDSAPRAGGARPKKTQEELDKEMEDYFGGDQQSNGVDGAQDSAASATAATEGDIDMAE